MSAAADAYFMIRLMDKEYIKSRYRSIMEWEGGQRLFNFAYSVGAAIVILGALFKITYLPGGNTLLCIGMGTEVLMFIITAFDRPPKDYRWEEVFPELDKEAAAAAGTPRTRVIPDAYADAAGHNGVVSCDAVAAEVTPAEVAAVTRGYVEQMAAIADNLAQLGETTRNLNAVSAVLLQSCQAIADITDAVTSGSKDYAEQIGDLNRDLKDVRYMYEKSAMQGARYCEEAEKMTRQMQELNRVYENMLRAMGSGNA